MLLQVHPGSLVLGAPAWLGFVVVVTAVVAAAGLEFTKAVAHEAAIAPVGQMQFVASSSEPLVPLADLFDPFLEQKRAAKFEELPAQF
jgi:hypothetical protein